MKNNMEEKGKAQNMTSGRIVNQPKPQKTQMQNGTLPAPTKPFVGRSPLVNPVGLSYKGVDKKGFKK